MPIPYCQEFVDLFHTYTVPFSEEITSEIQKVMNGIGNTNKLDLAKLYNGFLRLKMRPHHIGLGNPNSDILIVGHENAGQAPDLPAKDNPPQLGLTECTNPHYYRDLFVNEHILNYFLWAHKVAGVEIPPTCTFQDPEFASSYCHLYNTEKPIGHYWAKANYVISKMLNLDLDFRTMSFSDSFFNHCFLTEMHNNPSPSSPRNPDIVNISNKFEDLINNPFYTKFMKIVFACNTYLNHIPDARDRMQTAFGVSLIEEPATRNMQAIYEGNGRKIIICNNLNGAAGWANVELERMGRILSPQIFN